MDEKLFIGHMSMIKAKFPSKPDVKMAKFLSSVTYFDIQSYMSIKNEDGFQNDCKSMTSAKMAKIEKLRYSVDCVHINMPMYEKF